MSPISSLGRRLSNGFFIFSPPYHSRSVLCDLGFIDIIFPDLSVPELYDTVCHIFDGIIVRYHDHRVAVFLVDLLDQAEDFFWKSCNPVHPSAHHTEECPDF